MDQETKTKRLRFTYEDDVQFLREFVNINPLRTAQGWEVLQKNLLSLTGKNFSIKCLKQHLIILLDAFKKKVQVDEERYRGTLYGKNPLLEEISNMCDENDKCMPKKPKMSKEQQICQIGKTVREDYAQSLILGLGEHFVETRVEQQDVEIVDEQVIMEQWEFPNDHEYLMKPTISPSLEPMSTETLSKIQVSEGTKCKPQHITSTLVKMKKETSKDILAPTRKRLKREPIKKNALSYLTDKQEKDREIRLKELSLEERRVTIEEEKIKMEKKRLEIEEKRVDMELERIKLEKKENEKNVEEKKITNQILQSLNLVIANLAQKKPKKMFLSM